LCTAMLYDPADHYEPKETKQHFEEKQEAYGRLIESKKSRFLKVFRKKEKAKEPKKQQQKRSLVSMLFTLFA